MRKFFGGVFCLALCLTVALIFPQWGGSWPTVDDTVCFECHEAGSPGVSGETIMGEHTTLDCDQCHDGTPGPGNVNTSACIECHPLGDPGHCQLAIYHEEEDEYNPAGSSCFDCHPTCKEETSTTTTTDDKTSTTTTTDDETSTTTTAIECCLVEVYGEGSAEVAILRFIRDNVLSQTAEGQEIIRLYYQLSPLICEEVQNDEALREELKEMVDEILQLR